MTSGAEYFGSLAGADTGVLIIVGPVTDTIPFSEVVAIRQLESGFWVRTNGFLDVGTNFARANSLRSILGKGRFAYRGRTIGLNVTERYDSAPPSVNAQKRDYQYTFSIGWSWS